MTTQASLEWRNSLEPLGFTRLHLPPSDEQKGDNNEACFCPKRG